MIKIKKLDTVVVFNTNETGEKQGTLSFLKKDEYECYSLVGLNTKPSSMYLP